MSFDVLTVPYVASTASCVWR